MSPIQDIWIWVECFSTLATVLAAKFPQKIPQLMAYQKTIVRASRSFTGDGWVTYDSIFWRKAAACKSLDWGQIDFTRLGQAPTGRRARQASKERGACTQFKLVTGTDIIPVVTNTFVAPASGHTQWPIAQKGHSSTSPHQTHNSTTSRQNPTYEHFHH